MADVGATELSHRQEHGFVEKQGGVVTKRPDSNSVGPERADEVRDRGWNIAGIRHKLEQIKSLKIEEDEEDGVVGGAKDKKLPYDEDFDDAHVWHKVSEGKGSVTVDWEMQGRVREHEEQVSMGRWLQERLHIKRDH